MVIRGDMRDPLTKATSLDSKAYEGTSPVQPARAETAKTSPKTISFPNASGAKKRVVEGDDDDDTEEGKGARGGCSGGKVCIREK